MKHTSEITIQAPLAKIFAAASDLARWPEFLPHYRYNRFLSHTPSGGLVKSSWVRSGIPATAVVEYRIDTEKRQLHFHHLKSTLNATAGLTAIWTFKKLANGAIQVSITHEFKRKWPLLKLPGRDWIVAKFFINDIADRTLAGLKRKVEAQVVVPVVTARSKARKSAA
jgi:ribosome-associated toxin RatA of RatAB toxin-antitoxin module